MTKCQMYRLFGRQIKYNLIIRGDIKTRSRLVILSSKTRVVFGVTKHLQA